jgi:Tol biopolymer transport system component
MRRGTGATLAAVLVGVAVLSLSATAADDDLDLVSRATGPVGAGADGNSANAAISADGRYVLFGSEADNLSTEDDNNAGFNAFVRDLQAGTTTYVNRADGPTGAPAATGAFLMDISGDGQRVAFDGPATLVDPAAPGLSNIFLRDVPASTTTLISRATGADGARSDGSSFQPSMSTDSRLIAYESSADNLSTEDVPGVTDIFARDVVANTTTLVSRAGGPGGAGGDASSNSPKVSGDGRFVAFLSSANNLSDADVDGVRDVFVRDLALDLTILASRATGPSGAGGDGASGTTAISTDGRYVLFTSQADNLSTEDDNGVDNVFVRDLVANTTTLVSRATGAAGAAGNGSSAWGTISADGRLAVFHSLADNLSTEDADGVRDVFVRDLFANTTTLVSRSAGPAGAPGDGASQFPVISADGRRVVFASDANNLSADDLNAFTNIFRRSLPPPPPLPASPAGPGVIRGGGSTAGATARCAGVRATIVGTGKRNIIRGTARRDVIAALGGNDLVRGLGGNDLICLGAGNDLGIGGAGADRVLGQAGADRVEGGAGRDLLEGGAGPDLLLGGAGIDRLLGLAGRDRAVGGAGNDVCRVESRITC